MEHVPFRCQKNPRKRAQKHENGAVTDGYKADAKQV